MAPSGLYLSPTGIQSPVYPVASARDDTTLHLASRSDLQIALGTSLRLFCAASGSRLNASKSKGMILGSADNFTGPDPETGVFFLPKGESVTHLGVRLSSDPVSAARDTFAAIEASVLSAVRHWSSQQLSYLGRAHVAKQALASRIVYHSTFVPIPPATLTRVTSILAGYVAGSSGTMHPSRIVHALPWELGGMKLTLPADASASMQAKVISRFFELERLPWKRLFLAHFEVAGGPQAVFSTRRTQDLGIVSSRARSYVSSFRELQPRALSPTTHVLPSSPRRQDTDQWFISDDLPSQALLLRGGEWRTYPTSETGRLMKPFPVSGFVRHRLKPALVISWDSARPWRPGKHQPPDPGSYLLGPQGTGLVDPCLWEIEEATRRLTLFRAVKAGVLEHTDTSIKPPLWGGDTTGDDPVQIRWQSAIESARLSSTPGTQPQPKRPAQEAGLPDYSLGAFWLTAPQRARPHWRDRLASAPNEQGVSQLPLVSQMPSADATEQPPKVIRPWHHIWADLQDLALDRSHRYLAWQVLHATLPCGALRAYRAISRSYPQERHDRLLGEADCPNCTSARWLRGFGIGSSRSGKRCRGNQSRT